MGETGERLVRLIRDSLDSPWGFRLHGGMDYNAPLVVARVVTGSASDGNLRSGDVIKRIGYTDCTRIRHQDAIAAVTEAGSSLDIIINRPASIGNFRTMPSAMKNGPISRWKPHDPNEKTVIPQNKQLADIMQKSLTLGAESKRSKFTGSSRHTTELPMLREPSSARQLTSYLPTRASTTRCNWSVPPGGGPSSPNGDVHTLTNNSYRRSGGSQGSSRAGSARSSPAPGGASNLLELKSPGSSQAAVGVWSPPTQTPGAQLMHLQYNSPLNVYAANNVADVVEKMSGGKVEWLNQRPQANYLDDIKKSKTYQLVQELEGNRPPPSYRFEQSAAIKSMEHIYRREGLLK